MSSTLPSIVDNCCLTTCDDVVVQNVPGPAGDDGAAGAAGADGVNAYTVLTLAFTMPAEGAGATATVGSTAWITAGQIVYIAGLGYLTATTILSGTTFTATNPENAASGAYASNAAAGTIAAIGSKVSPAGIQGPAGTVSAGTLVGDVTGTIGANELTLNDTIGSIPVGDGSKAQKLVKGTDGDIFVTDSAEALDVNWKHIIPRTGDSVLADNRVPRLDGATGLPIPLQSSKVTINDQGAITADGSGGNARGTDAVDLQVTRGAATQVASGATAVISGGRNNTASGADSVVGGGDGNIASATESGVFSGNGNTASGQYAVVGGGNGNVASLNNAVVCGGGLNTASAQYSCVVNGISNTAANNHSGIFASSGCTANGYRSAIIGSASATTGASAGNGVILAGQGASGESAGSVCMGGYAKTTMEGQVAHSNYRFASAGDAQTSEILWMISTGNATPTEMSFDGVSAAKRAILPNNTSWMFDIRVIARTSAGLDSIYTSIGVIRNNAGVTTINGVTTTEVYDGAGLPATPVTVDADAGNNALRITVTGIAATNIVWLAVGKLTQVTY